MDNINAGHRERLKEIYLKDKLQSQPDHVLLELLLTYSIPRKDVKPVAKHLISTFGSLENVFSASLDTLMTVDGVGKNTAILITHFANISKRIAQNKLKNTRKAITNQVVKDYFQNMFEGDEVEKFVLMCLDNSNRIISCDIVAEGIVNDVDIQMRRLAEISCKNKISKAIIAHNHPYGFPLPSSEDINITLKIRDFFNVMDIQLIDHIIVGENAVFSMRADPVCREYF